MSSKNAPRCLALVSHCILLEQLPLAAAVLVGGCLTNLRTDQASEPPTPCYHHVTMLSDVATQHPSIALGQACSVSSHRLPWLLLPSAQLPPATTLLVLSPLVLLNEELLLSPQFPALGLWLLRKHYRRP